MLRAIRRTLSSVAVLALVAGSALIAAPAYAADPDIHISFTSPAEGQTIYSPYSYNQVTVVGSTGADTQWASISVDGRFEANLPPGDFSATVWVMGFGAHTIAVQAYNAAGLPVGPRFLNLNVVEPTSPTVTITTPTENSIYSGVSPLQVRVSTVLGNQGLQISDWMVEIRTSGGVYFVDRTGYGPPPETVEFDVSTWATGDYQVSVFVEDVLLRSAEAIGHFSVDTTKPTVGITATMETPISAATVVEGTYSDQGSGVDSVVLKFANCDLYYCFPKPGLSVAASLDGAGTWSASLPALDYERWGYQIIATATDAAGNTATTQQFFYVIDTAAPSVPVPLSPSGLVGPVSEFDWTDATDASNDVHYDWQLLSPSTAAAEACPAPPAPCPSAVPTTGTTSVSHLTRITPLTTEGGYKFRVRAVDALGNASAWSAYLEFTIDSTRPYVYFDLTADADVNSMTPLLGGYGDGKGGGSGVDKLELTVQNWDGDAEECTSMVGDPILASLDNGTWSADLPAIGFGHYCIVATATDGVGNIGTDVGRFWIDTIAPDAPEPIAPGPISPVGTFAWSDVFDDSELGVSYEYEISDPSGPVGSPGTTTDSYATLDGTLTSGEYHFRVRAIDAFGNPSDWSDDQSFLVDTTAPTVSLVAPTAGGSSATSDVTFRWTSPDDDLELFVLQVSPTAGVDEYGQLTDGETWVLSDSSQLVTGLANGRYYWHVIAYDQAWNESAWSELRTLDIAKPAPPKSSGHKATGDESDSPEPTETTEPTPEPSATEEPVEKTDDEADAGSDDGTAGGSDPTAAGTGDSGFPVVWIIVGVVIVALAGGGFFIRFLLRRA